MHMIRIAYKNGEKDDYRGYTESEVNDFLTAIDEGRLLLKLPYKVLAGADEYVSRGTILIAESEIRKIEIQR
jgi:hypothetical protein